MCTVFVRCCVEIGTRENSCVVMASITEENMSRMFG
jgi:hypothetical protein